MTIVFAVFVISDASKKQVIKINLPPFIIVAFLERIREVKFVKSVTISYEHSAVRWGLCS
jgi:hypothetical protein